MNQQPWKRQAARQRGWRAALTLVTAFGVSLLLACGSSTGSTQPGGTGTVSGAAVKGPVHGATVTAFAVSNGAKGSALGSTTTDAAGRFTVSIGGYSGPVLLECAGGTYTDEATATTMTMGSGDVMRAVMGTVAANVATAGIAVTPLTSMAQARAQGMTGGMMDAHITAANAAVGHYFMVDDILHTMPMDPLTPGSGATATPGEVNCGVAIAGLSQYAHTIGMSASSGIVTAMMDDASDGVMDGMMGATPISMSGMGGMMGGPMMQRGAGSSGLADAISTFVGSAANHSGVTAQDVQPLVQALGGADGVLR